jgi:hypothetical protein
VQDRREGHLALRKFDKKKNGVRTGETKDDNSIEQNKTRKLKTETYTSYFMRAHRDRVCGY